MDEKLSAAPRNVAGVRLNIALTKNLFRLFLPKKNSYYLYIIILYDRSDFTVQILGIEPQEVMMTAGVIGGLCSYVKKLELCWQL